MAKYDDIINLPHHVSATRRPMSMEGRAAQFSSFAALHGHDEAIGETARLTSARIELSADEQRALSQRMAVLVTAAPVAVTVTYFVADDRKAGGAYWRASGTLIKIDGDEGVIVMDGRRKIPLADVVAVDSDVLVGYDY